MFWEAATVFLWCAGTLFLMGGAAELGRIPRLLLAAAGGAAAVCCLFLPVEGTVGMLTALGCGWALFLMAGLLLFKDRLRLVFNWLLSVQLGTLLLPAARFGPGSEIWEYAFYTTAALLAALSPFVWSRTGQLPHGKMTGQFPGAAELPLWALLFPAAGLLWQAVIFALIRGDGLSTLFLGTLALAPAPLLSLLGFRLTSELLESNRREREMGRWQQESRDYMSVIRAQRHDYNFHLHAVVGLIENGEYEECRRYLEKMAGEAADVNDIMPVSDAVVGSMLHNMRQEARKRGSNITYDITYDMADVLCNGFECNKIIGNLLQNALDALTTREALERGIHMAIFKRRGNTVITVENYFDGDKDQIARVFEPGYSTKHRHEGIGLSMVLRTVRQYGGRVYPEFEEDLIRFVVNIPNKVNLSEGEEK